MISIICTFSGWVYDTNSLEYKFSSFFIRTKYFNISNLSVNANMFLNFLVQTCSLYLLVHRFCFLYLVTGLLIYFGYGMWNSNIEARFHDTTRKSKDGKEAILMATNEVNVSEFDENWLKIVFFVKFALFYSIDWNQLENTWSSGVTRIFQWGRAALGPCFFFGAQRSMTSPLSILFNIKHAFCGGTCPQAPL